MGFCLFVEGMGEANVALEEYRAHQQELVGKTLVQLQPWGSRSCSQGTGAALLSEDKCS